LDNEVYQLNYQTTSATSGLVDKLGKTRRGFTNLNVPKPNVDVSKYTTIFEYCKNFCTSYNMKKILISIAALVMLCVTCGSLINGGIVSAGSALLATSPDPVINWGLTPNSREVTPEAPKGGAELLRKHGGMFVCDANAEAGEKKVYFTFDLGYEAGFTGAVLDILKENGIKATFFLCGNYLQEDELVGRMISEGHTIGNHTDRHKDLPRLGFDAMRKDIKDFDEKFYAKFGEVYGKKMTQFRPPQGRFNEKVLKEVADQGMKTMMWSIAIVDWGKTAIPVKPNADKIAKRIHPGAIILFHITNSSMPEILKQLIPQLQERGYSIGDAGSL